MKNKINKNNLIPEELVKLIVGGRIAPYPTGNEETIYHYDEEKSSSYPTLRKIGNVNE